MVCLHSFKYLKIQTIVAELLTKVWLIVIVEHKEQFQKNGNKKNDQNAVT